MTQVKPWLRKEQTKLENFYGEQILIKKLSYGDAQEIQSSIMKVDDEGKPQLDLSRMKTLQAVKGIKSWTLTDEGGNTLPITEHTINEVLDPEASIEIVNLVDKFNQVTIKEADKKN